MRTQRDLLQEETGNQVRHMIQPQQGDVAGWEAQGKQSGGWVMCISTSHFPCPPDTRKCSHFYQGITQAHLFPVMPAPPKWVQPLHLKSISF